MVTLQTTFLVFLIGIILFFFGRYFEDYTSGILGGFTLFLTGVLTYTTPIENIDSTMNLLVASVFFALGAYIWITGSLELLKDKNVI